MKQPIILKKDRRFKKGNIKTERNGFRGHPETMSIDLAELPHLTELHSAYWQTIDLHNQSLALQLNPPIIVSRELGEKLKEVL